MLKKEKAAKAAFFNYLQISCRCDTGTPHRLP